MTEPNDIPLLLGQVDGYELHFGNEARVRDGDQPTLGNLLIEKLALAVRTLCARVSELEVELEQQALATLAERGEGDKHASDALYYAGRVVDLEAERAANRASIDVLSDEVHELRDQLRRVRGELGERGAGDDARYLTWQGQWFRFSPAPLGPTVTDCKSVVWTY